MKSNRPLATPEQVAAYLGDGFPVRTLEMWRYRGTGPRFLKVGRHIRYRWSDVEAWLAEQENMRLVGGRSA